MFGRGTTNEIAERIRVTAEELVALVNAQIRLARLELSADARALGARLARMAVFVPLILLGYAFLMAAVVAALRPALGLIGALGVVGGANVAAGLFGCVRASRALREVRVLDRSRGAIERSVEEVAAAATTSARREA
jgi:uncharacterized membrane protein YqjE